MKNKENRIIFTDKELELLKGIANRTWQNLSQGLPIGSYSRNQVFEFSVNANQLKGFYENSEQKEADLKFYKLDWKEQERFAKDLFPFHSYE